MILIDILVNWWNQISSKLLFHKFVTAAHKTEQNLKQEQFQFHRKFHKLLRQIFWNLNQPNSISLALPLQMQLKRNFSYFSLKTR